VPVTLKFGGFGGPIRVRIAGPGIPLLPVCGLGGAFVTEAEWLAGGDPSRMLEFLADKASPRRLRLFAVACFLDDWAVWSDPRERRAVLTAERLADAAWGAADRDAALARLIEYYDELDDLTDLECAPKVPYALLAPDFSGADAGVCAYEAEAQAEYGPGSFEGRGTGAREVQADLLRDIVGNPFRPAACDSRWRTEDAVGLARGIYEEKAFARLPLLADALMDAGCDDEQILGHCQSEGPHARGCWVVDLVLGKE
jgi:hypothetical protein